MITKSCDRPGYRKALLKPIKEMPFIGLFEDLKGKRKFEASGKHRVCSLKIAAEP
jgi:hypothetical protein